MSSVPMARSLSCPSPQGATGAVSTRPAGKSGPFDGRLFPHERQLSGKRDRCPERVAAFLRQMHPVKTAEAVAAETGLACDTVRKWLARASAPALPALLALIAVYGPDFLDAVLARPPDWVVRAAQQRRLVALEAEQARLSRMILDLRGEDDAATGRGDAGRQDLGGAPRD